MDYILHGAAKGRTRLSNFHFTKPKQLITSMANILDSFMGHKTFITMFNKSMHYLVL